MLVSVCATVCDDAVVRKDEKPVGASKVNVCFGISFDMSRKESAYALKGAELAVNRLNEETRNSNICFGISVVDDGGDPRRLYDNISAFCENNITMILCDGRYADSIPPGCIALSPFVSDSYRSLRPDCAGYGCALAGFISGETKIRRVSALCNPESTESVKLYEELENAADDRVSCRMLTDVGSGLENADACFVTDSRYLLQIAELDRLLPDGAVIFCTDGALEDGIAELPKTKHFLYLVTDFVPDFENSRFTDFMNAYSTAYGDDAVLGCTAAAYDGICAFYNVLSDEGIDAIAIMTQQTRFVARSMREQSFRFRGVSGCGADMVWNGTCFEKKLTVIKVSPEVLS